jgi:hypothetical protein
VSSVEEQISDIEQEIRETPYNKATQLHIGRLKAKLARLKEQKEKKGNRKGIGYAPKKSGDATCILLGYPSAGKSTLLNALTNAKSVVGTYDFTTLDVIPGSLVHKGALIQILDVPGLIRGAAAGKGRGKEIISVVRSADLILIVVDVFCQWQVDVIKNELYEAGIRINQRSPDIAIIKKSRGGVSIKKACQGTGMDDATIIAILNDFKIHNADVIIKEEINVDRLVDALVSSRRFIPAITVVNKTDQSSRPPNFGDVHISAQYLTNLERLKDLIFEKLAFIRVYLKPPGKAADIQKPLILRRNSTVGEVCHLIRKQAPRRFRYAQVWGPSAKYAGQRVGLDHRLQDNDTVTLVAFR